MELGRGTLMDSSGPGGKGHSWGTCQSSVGLAQWLHLGKNNPANKNLDKTKSKFQGWVCVHFIKGWNNVMYLCVWSPCGVEAPYEPQYSPEGHGVQTERENAPVWLLKVPKGQRCGRAVPAGQKWPRKRALCLLLLVDCRFVHSSSCQHFCFMYNGKISDLHSTFKVYFTTLTSWADWGLLSGWGRTHGPFGAYYTVGSSRGRTVSAGLTGHLDCRANRTAMASGAEVAMGTVRWHGAGAATKANIPVGINKSKGKTDFISQILPQAAIQKSWTICQWGNIIQKIWI